MLTALTLGLTLWVVYGALRGDWVIVYPRDAFGGTFFGMNQIEI